MPCVSSLFFAPPSQSLQKAVCAEVGTCVFCRRQRCLQCGWLPCRWGFLVVWCFVCPHFIPICFCIPTRWLKRFGAYSGCTAEDGSKNQHQFQHGSGKRRVPCVSRKTHFEKRCFSLSKSICLCFSTGWKFLCKTAPLFVSRGYKASGLRKISKIFWNQTAEKIWRK